MPSCCRLCTLCPRPAHAAHSFPEPATKFRSSLPFGSSATICAVASADPSTSPRLSSLTSISRSNRAAIAASHRPDPPLVRSARTPQYRRPTVSGITKTEAAAASLLRPSRHVTTSFHRRRSGHDARRCPPGPRRHPPRQHIRLSGLPVSRTARTGRQKCRRIPSVPAQSFRTPPVRLTRCRLIRLAGTAAGGRPRPCRTTPLQLLMPQNE